jgi:hypothetical protein
MFEKIFWAAVGAFVMRYVILNTPDYKAKEAEKIDKIKTGVSNFFNQYVSKSQNETELNAGTLDT